MICLAYLQLPQVATYSIEKSVSYHNGDEGNKNTENMLHERPTHPTKEEILQQYTVIKYTRETKERTLLEVNDFMKYLRRKKPIATP